jgi:hypothetical protein
MTYTITNYSEAISLAAGKIMFVCECDDGRYVLISGEFCERFQLPEILSQISAQLCNLTVEVPPLMSAAEIIERRIIDFDPWN